MDYSPRQRCQEGWAQVRSTGSRKPQTRLYTTRAKRRRECRGFLQAESYQENDMPLFELTPTNLVQLADLLHSVRCVMTARPLVIPEEAVSRDVVDALWALGEEDGPFIVLADDEENFGHYHPWDPPEAFAFEAENLRVNHPDAKPLCESLLNPLMLRDGRDGLTAAGYPFQALPDEDSCGVTYILQGQRVLAVLAHYTYFTGGGNGFATIHWTTLLYAVDPEAYAKLLIEHASEGIENLVNKPVAAAVLAKRLAGEYWGTEETMAEGAKLGD